MNSRPSPGIEINGVTCAIYHGENADEGGIVETWTDRGLEVTISFACAWSDRIKLIQGLRGAVSWDGGIPGTIYRTKPINLPPILGDMCPDTPDLEGIDYYWQRYICTSTDTFHPKTPRNDFDATITGYAGWCYYDYVVIRAHFTSPSYFVADEKLKFPFPQGYDISGYPYTTTTTRSSGEIFAPYTNQFQFASAPNSPINEANVAIMRPKTEITVTRHYMPVVDTLTLTAIVGAINKDKMTFGTYEYPAESILYLSHEVESYSDVSTGLLCYDIKHNLIANGPVIGNDEKSISSWNYYLRPDNGKWDKLQTKDGTTPYQTDDIVKAIWPEY